MRAAVSKLVNILVVCEHFLEESYCFHCVYTRVWYHRCVATYYVCTTTRINITVHAWPYYGACATYDFRVSPHKILLPHFAISNPSPHHTIQYNTVQYNTIQYNTIQYNTIQYNTIQYNTIQYNTIQYNTIQYNTIQYNTIQYNTIQYNTIQYQCAYAQRAELCGRA